MPAGPSRHPRVYDSARYATYLYDTEPEPPLDENDRAWARQYLPQIV